MWAALALAQWEYPSLPSQRAPILLCITSAHESRRELQPQHVRVFGVSVSHHGRTLYVPLAESCMDYTWVPGDPAQTAVGGLDIRFTLRLRPDTDGKSLVMGRE